MKNILTNDMNGNYLKVYTNKTITQDRFNAFLRMRNGLVTLESICLIECNLKGIDFNIVNRLNNVVIMNCSTNETFAGLLAINELSTEN